MVGLIYFMIPRAYDLSFLLPCFFYVFRLVSGEGNRDRRQKTSQGVGGPMGPVEVMYRLNRVGRKISSLIFRVVLASIFFEISTFPLRSFYDNLYVSSEISTVGQLSASCSSTAASLRSIDVFLSISPFLPSPPSLTVLTVKRLGKS